jgi:hypothetical protein
MRRFRSHCGSRFAASVLFATVTFGAPLAATAPAAFALPRVGCGIDYSGPGSLGGVPGTFYFFICSDGSRVASFVPRTAPIIESASLSQTGTSQVTALLHSNRDFRFLVDRVTGYTTEATPNTFPASVRKHLPKTFEAPVLLQLGTIALGLQQEGTASISFFLKPNGKTLRAGRYELLLQALNRNGTVKSTSAPLFTVVASNGTITTSG